MAVKITLRHAPPLHVPRRCNPRHHLPQPPSPRYSSDFSHLREEMTSRVVGYSIDYMNTTQSRSLRLTLADYLPSASKTRKGWEYSHLPSTHHLVYFPKVPRSSLLLPDGTDSLHSPGPPFTRRMWAGGSMSFTQDIKMDGQPFHCNEWIQDVQVMGKEGEEKVFVKIRRAVFAGRYPGQFKGQFLGPRIIEYRTLVFMRDARKEGPMAVSQSSSKLLKPTQAPDFSHIMVPTRELLFRFSALTFNAHAIHLDKQFCREVEGHRNLLVHGPLTVVLMIEVLQRYLKTLADRGRFSTGGLLGTIKSVDYKNLSPLYAEEEMKICVRRRGWEAGERRNEIWDVWIEGQDGGYAVKGTVRMLSYSIYGHFFNEPGIAEQDGDSLEEESIAEERVDSQNTIKASQVTAPNKESRLDEGVAPREKTEKQAEGKTGKEREEEPGKETMEEIEEETSR